MSEDLGRPTKKVPDSARILTELSAKRERSGKNAPKEGTHKKGDKLQGGNAFAEGK